MEKNKSESGIILIGLLFLVVLIMLGYVVFNSVTKSREARQAEATSQQSYLR